MADTKNDNEMLYTDYSTMQKDVKEIIKSAFAKASKGVATVDFSKVVSTASEYTKDQLKSALQNGEQEDIETLISFSNSAYREYGEYKQLLHRFSGVHKFRYYVEPVYSFSKDNSDIASVMDKVQDYIKVNNPNETMHNICLKALKYGTTYVYFNEVDGRQCIQFLPSDYCRTKTFDSYGNRIVQMNMKYFEDEYSEEWERELLFKQLPKEFKKLYNSYLNSKSNIGDVNNPEWQELDSEFACAFQFGEDGLPYFAAIFPDLLDFQEYKNMAKLDSELDLFGLLVQKMQFNKDGDLEVDEDTFEGLQADLAKIAKVGGLGAMTTPYDITALKLKDKETNKQDYVAQGLTNIYNSASLSESTFNSNGKNSGSLGITSSNQMLSGVFENLVSQFKTWYVKKLNGISGSTVLDFHILDITCFNEKEKVATYKDQLATANGSWMVYMSAVGIGQFEGYNMVRFEDEIALRDYLQPLVTSYTNSGSVEDIGAPEKDIKSDSTIEKIDSGQEENRGDKENK